MKEEKIHKILEELYLIDPSLKEHQETLLKLIESIIESRPTFSIDEQFIIELKRKLLTQSQPKNINEKITDLFKTMNYKKYTGFVGASAVLAALIIIPLFTISLLKQNQDISFDLTIDQTGKRAFGLLSAPETLNQRETGFGGGGTAASNSAYQADKMMILPTEPEVKYNYIYEGEVPELANNVNVLKRIKDKNASTQAAGIVKNLNFDLIDLSKFGDFGLQNLTLVQNKPFGHIININLEEGSISINENWLTWPQSQCQDEACFNRERVTIDQIPNDEILINIANSFMNQHNISTENHGDPEIATDWKTAYQNSEDKTNFYIPDAITVTYPLKIQGMFVYDQWGGIKEGIQVNISLKHQKVLSVYNINSQKYQSSAYPAITNIDKIKELISKGGFGNYQPENTDRTEDIILGDPEIAYVKIWKYENNINHELLVPSLIFPITNPPKNQLFFRKSIAIPLVEEIINSQDGPIIMPVDDPIIGGAEPTPLIKELR